MKIKIFTFLMLGLMSYFGSKGQNYPLVSIHDIQYISKDSLSNCLEGSHYNGDTVRIRGVAVMRGDQSTAYVDTKGIPTTREIYIQDGSGPWSGIDVFTIGGGTTTSPTDIYSLVPGDSIEVTGIISEYNGQTEIEPITTLANGNTFSNNVKYLGASKNGPKYTTVALSDLNDTKSVNQLSTGEQWESVYIELKNVSVTSVPTGSRTQFIVSDVNGNSATVFDRFFVQRNSANGNTFKVPHVGDIFKSLKGVTSQYASGGVSCTNGTYEIYPFDSTDYQYSLSAPVINSVTRKPLAPKSADGVKITANVTPFNTRGIKNVVLYYKTGADTSVNSGYTAVVMTANGANYEATIPKQADGTLVKYYVTAVDTISANPLRSFSPSIKTPGIFPYFYTVRDKGLTIYDVQFRPLVSGLSAYNNSRVVVSGVVTASFKDLGYFYIQQPGINAWAGINLKGSTQLANFNTGDYITVGGTVTETNSYTQITVDSVGMASGSYTIHPVSILDTVLTKGDLKYRMYMQMLTTIKPVGSKLKVVQLNADAPSNYADFRVGEDLSTPTIGTRVTAGNTSSNDPGSLNFPYVNDSTWLPGLKVKAKRVLSTSDDMDSISGIMLYNFSNYKLMPRTSNDVYGISNPVTGIARAHSLANTITVYPNPSNGGFHIVFSGNTHEGTMNIQLFDLAGKLVYHDQCASSAGQLNIRTGLNAGAYILAVTSPDGSVAHTRILISK